MIENDQEIPYDLYELTSGDLFMLIRVEADEVSHISFGGLNAYHFWDKNEPTPADPYTFTPYDTLSGGTVTAYSRTGSGWEKQVLTEKRAKHLVTALNIMDPEPSAVQGEPVIWLEFESGGALPDFEAACKRANVPYTAFARPKMVHCYCMLPVFQEAKEDFAKIAEILKQ